MKIFFTSGLLLSILISIQAQQYKPIETKSSIQFTIKNFGINTGGVFKGPEGVIEFDRANPEKAVFNITVDAASVNTDNITRDNHLRGEEYFDTDKYPKIHFASEKVTGRGNVFTMTGKLTMKGISKTISFPFTAEAKEEGYLFEGNFQLNRRDFKVGGNSMVLADNVTVKLSVFAGKK